MNLFNGINVINENRITKLSLNAIKRLRSVSQIDKYTTKWTSFHSGHNSHMFEHVFKAMKCKVNQLLKETK